MKLRSFLAFDIPDSMRAELAKLIELLASKARDVKWVRPENIHCTIKFFGDVDEELLAGDIATIIAREVRHQAPLSLHGVGLGVFPNWRYPRVIWAGLTGDTESAIGLHHRLDSALTRFNIEPDSREQFRMHLTLGRVRTRMKNPDAIVTFVEKQVDRAFGDVTVDRLTLYKSVLTKEGSIYTPVRTFQFGQP